MVKRSMHDRGRVLEEAKSLWRDVSVITVQHRSSDRLLHFPGPEAILPSRLGCTLPPTVRGEMSEADSVGHADGRGGEKIPARPDVYR